MHSTEIKSSVEELKRLATKQRELNDAQTQARRAAWDNHLARVSSAEDVQALLRDLAATPVAW